MNENNIKWSLHFFMAQPEWHPSRIDLEYGLSFIALTSLEVSLYLVWGEVHHCYVIFV